MVPTEYHQSIRRYLSWHYQTSPDGTRTQQEAHAEHLTSLRHAERPRSLQLVEQGISLPKHLQHVARLTSRKRNLQLAEALAVRGTNKNESNFA